MGLTHHGRLARVASKRAGISLLLLLGVCAQIPLRAQTTPGNTQRRTAAGIWTSGLILRRPYEPITARQRLLWTFHSTVGPESLAAGVLTAGIGTANNDPAEFGPSWAGFGKRYGIRMSGIATQNVLEASLGSIWGEDPRYERLPGSPFRDRIWNIIKLTFAARYRDGGYGPAYARFGAISGANVLSDAWRARSETGAGDTAFRVFLGVLGRMSSNAFVEFWPDVRKHLEPHDEENP
jgi:hypothetical protein